MFVERRYDAYRTIELRDDGNLWYVRGPKSAYQLRATAPGRFEVLNFFMPATVTFTGDGITVEAQGNKPLHYVRAEPHTPSAEELGAYAGEYASDEVFGRHRLRVVDGKLMVRVGYDKNELPLLPRERDVFEGAGTTLRFERDPGGRVAGYTVSAGRVKGIRFTRG